MSIVPVLTSKQCAAESQLVADLAFLDQLTTDGLLSASQRNRLAARVASESGAVIGGFIWRFQLDKSQT